MSQSFCYAMAASFGVLAILWMMLFNYILFGWRGKHTKRRNK